MSAHAVAAASGCCCAPAPTPCTCQEYGLASAGPDFDTLHVSGRVLTSYSGADCCDAQLTGGSSFDGATIVRAAAPFSGWNIQKQQVCPGLFLGPVIGSALTTVGRCTYVSPCCNYTGCPPANRTVIDSELLRYATDIPAQALAYELGHIGIELIRQGARQRMGAAFDVRGLHDALLVNGGYPLPVLQGQIERWVATHQAEAG